MSEDAKIIFKGSHCPPNRIDSAKKGPHNFTELPKNKITTCKNCGLTFQEKKGTISIIFEGSDCAGESYKTIHSSIYNSHHFEYSENKIFCKNCGLTIQYA